MWVSWWGLSRCDRPPAFSGRKRRVTPCDSIPRLNGAGLSQRDRPHPYGPVLLSQTIGSENLTDF